MSTNWKTPPPAERRGTRNTDLVREISNTYDVTPEAIERIVLGDGALPDAVATNVTMGRVAELASQAFDFVASVSPERLPSAILMRSTFTAR